MTDVVRAAHALVAAFGHLRDPQSRLGAKVRNDLLGSTGLTPAMIDWGLQTSLPTSASEILNAVANAPPRRDDAPHRVAVILAGNVFTASIRALAWPLLLGAKVTAKASSHDDVLPRALLDALLHVDPVVAETLTISTFDRSHAMALQTLLTDCDVVSVYGSDETVEAVRRASPPQVTLVAHGHGVSAIVIPRAALDDTTAAQAWAERAALDVAAYDQRGCLSPHTVWVEAGSVPAPQFATMLADALNAMEAKLPRGRLPEDVAAAQAQWRGVAIACGELLEGRTFGVAIDDGSSAAPLQRVGPGYRNVSVRSCIDIHAMWSALAPLGVHLKALGVAGDERAITNVASFQPTLLRPHLTPVGTMQTPAFGAPADGEAPWFGLRG